MYRTVSVGFLLSVSLLLFLPFLGSAAQDETRLDQNDSRRIRTIEGPINEIKFPLSSRPAIVQQGCPFQIKVDLSSLDEELLNAGCWNVTLSTAYDEYVESYILPVSSIEVKGGLFNLEAMVPKEGSIDLYNLTVAVTRKGKTIEDSQPRAVSVVSKIKDSFTFIQVTDPHCWDIRTRLASPGKTLGEKRENFTKSEAYNETIREVNLIHPDFVLLTGDFIGGPFPINIPSLKSLEDQYKTAYDLLQRFDVPAYLIPGNHDGYFSLSADGLKLYEKYFGELFYSFDYNDAHFVMLNSYDWPYLRRSFINAGGKIGEDQLEWFEENLESAQKAGTVFVCLHHDSLEEGLHGFRGKDPFFDLIDRSNVTMVLAGHVHKDSERAINDTVFLTTTSCATTLSYDRHLRILGEVLNYLTLSFPREEPNPLKYDQYWGFRQVKVKDNGIESYAYGEGGRSIPTYRLSANYSEGREKALIKSELENPLEVKVELHTEDENYRIIGGEMLWEREVDGVKILTCRVEVPPNEQVEVEVVEVAPMPKPVPLTLYRVILLSSIAIVLLVYYLLKVRKRRMEGKKRES